MKNFKIHLLFVLFLITLFSCAENDTPTPSSNEDLALEHRAIQAGCGKYLDDFEDPLCIVKNSVGIPIPTDGELLGTTSLADDCNSVFVTLDYTVCYGGALPGQPGNGMLESLVITNFEIDWDNYDRWCPDLPMPSTPQEQMEFMEELRKEFANYAEQILVGMEYAGAGNPSCEDPLVANFPVQTTRVESGCYTYCEVIGWSSSETQPIIVRRVPCSGTKCCARMRTYCRSMYAPYTLKVLSEEITLLDDNCELNSRCENPLTASCDKECGDQF